MQEFKVGSKVVPASSFVTQDIYTIIAIGEPGESGYPAWVKARHQAFGCIMDLEYMKHYFEPGYYRLKLHEHADVKYYTSDPNDIDDVYERMDVTTWEEDDDE